MQVLKIKQTRSDGAVKTWKLDSSHDLITFGGSRKAALLSIDPEVSAYELVFECRDGNWQMTNFSQSAEPACRPIQDGAEIQLPKSTLQFHIVKRSPFVLKRLSQLNADRNKPSRFVMVTRNEQIIHSCSLDGKNTFTFDWGSQTQTFDFTKDNCHEWNGLKIFCYYSDKIADENIFKNQSEFNLKSPQVRLYSGLFGFVLLLVMLSFLAPATKPVLSEVKLVPVSSTLIQTNFKKTKAGFKAPQQPTQARLDSGAAPSNAQAQKVKNAIGARISQLLSKVSAAEARSKNIVVAAQGVKAGEGPSGRALASLGQVNASGRDWNSDAKAGQAVGVGTAGRGGGRGTGQMGAGLAQGSTGQGGVGLIEDESEIVGGLDREVIAQYIKTQLGQILYCYERQLSASPDLYGKIAVKFTIAGTGAVETQSINDTTLKNQQVENCILNKIAKWKFPEPRGGTKVLVTYPFLFKSTN